MKQLHFTVHTLAVVTAICFVVSLIFPAAAGLSKHTETFPRWWGTADVGWSLVVGILAVAILAATRGKAGLQAEKSSYQIYRALIDAILAVCLAVIYLGDWIVWPNCATGFLWRLWLFLYVLPNWFTALQNHSNDLPLVQNG